MRNLLVRTASGIVLFGIVLGAALMGYIGFSALMLVIMCGGLWEFYALARAKGAEPQRFLGLICSLAIFSSVFIVVYPWQDGIAMFFEMRYPPIVFVAGVAVAALCVMLSFVFEVFRNRPNPMINIAMTLMGVIYLALPIAVMLFIPSLLQGYDYDKDPQAWNPLYFLFYLFLVWGNDVFAYLTGISFGKHKLCERLSPKKSWEGFVGGIIGSVAMGAVAACVLEANYLLWMGLALVVALASVVGDLVESMFKRDAGVKDSGNILPGHGGILDRFDALIVSAPFALLYLIVAAIFMAIFI